MPELPDLEVFSASLTKQLKGKKVKAVKGRGTTVKKEITGQVLEKVEREGKELRFRFRNGAVLGMHLMLHGELHVFRQKNTNAHTMLEISFEDGTGLALTDFRKMASYSMNPGTPNVPDALTQLKLPDLEKLLSGSRATVKKQLTDQHKVRGIGNAYADEILWEARISPFSVSRNIPPQKVKTLHKAIRSVLKDAVKQIRKHHKDATFGEYREFLKIHRAGKGESPAGAAIKHASTGGRKTYYTDEQEKY
ncbi:DNA-formamidopyrimidine glycosylase family protein [Chitinophaga sp.]|uniref:DNA-formamidopyrimidine glycosylase family protein n=1 Tax=Chitinophaga sp. TaxID=1869181 RepID=UPI0031D20D63